MIAVLAALAALIAPATADDPAPGWMGYAVGTHSPCTGDCRVTYMEAKWVVPADPQSPGAFFSPWFGIESYDNKNLIQPVNPWTGFSWSFYNEQFRWDPEFNYNSPSRPTKAGHILFGSVQWEESNSTYTVYHSDMTTGESVTSSLNVQVDPATGKPKPFTMSYIVMEKSQWQCDQYPSNGEVLFYDIRMEYDNAPVTPTWKTAFVDDNCNCRASVVNSTAVKITWSTGRSSEE